MFKMFRSTSMLFVCLLIFLFNYSTINAQEKISKVDFYLAKEDRIYLDDGEVKNFRIKVLGTDIEKTGKILIKGINQRNPFPIATLLNVPIGRKIEVSIEPVLSNKFYYFVKPPYSINQLELRHFTTGELKKYIYHYKSNNFYVRFISKDKYNVYIYPDSMEEAIRNLTYYEYYRDGAEISAAFRIDDNRYEIAYNLLYGRNNKLKWLENRRYISEKKKFAERVETACNIYGLNCTSINMVNTVFDNLIEDLMKIQKKNIVSDFYVNTTELKSYINSYRNNREETAKLIKIKEGDLNGK